jgi:hypothetical protein
VKRAVAAIVAVVMAFFAANMLAVAVAEAPTVTSLRTISVQGVATLPIGQFDDGTAATAVYREAMSAAVTDGQGKAAFLASKIGGTLATVQSVVEGGGYINCIGGGESSYAEYGGVEPDFGSGTGPATVVAPASAATPTKDASSGGALRRVKPKRPKHKHPTAKKAAASVTCSLTAQVSLNYAMG